MNVIGKHLYFSVSVKRGTGYETVSRGIEVSKVIDALRGNRYAWAEVIEAVHQDHLELVELGRASVGD